MSKTESKQNQPLWIKALGALAVLVAGALGLLKKDDTSTGSASGGASDRVAIEEPSDARRGTSTPAAPPSIRSGSEPSSSTAANRSGSREDEPADDGSAAKIAAAFRAHRGDMWLEGSGSVQRTLPDDNEGSRHQRFILELSNGHTVLVAHNIDLAPRVPLERGDRLRFYGEYEWSEQGGVIHWTHHDPGGRRKGGWIELDGKRYE